MDEKLTHVLHQVELLCEQNLEFADALREQLKIVSPAEPNVGAPSQDSFASAMRHQHEQCRKRARYYYREIKDKSLRKDLINDHAKMLWYKSIFEIGQYFVLVNYQVENMLNFYLDKTDFHAKIAANPTDYCLTLEINSKYSVSIDAYSYAFDKNNGNSPIEPSRINSLWVKLLYWALDTGQNDILEKYKTYFNAIISVRNEVNHANYASQKLALKYWQNQEDGMQFAFVEAVIKQIRKSIVSL